MSLKARDGMAGYLRHLALFGIPGGLIVLAENVSIYLFTVVLVCGGLFLILVLRRAFKLDRAIDDPERMSVFQNNGSRGREPDR